MKLYRGCLLKFRNGNDAQILSFMARCYVKMEQFAEAERALQRALHLDPTDHRHVFNLALAQQQQALYLLAKDNLSLRDIDVAEALLQRAGAVFARLATEGEAMRESGRAKMKYSPTRAGEEGGKCHDLLAQLSMRRTDVARMEKEQEREARVREEKQRAFQEEQRLKAEAEALRRREEEERVRAEIAAFEAMQPGLKQIEAPAKPERKAGGGGKRKKNKGADDAFDEEVRSKGCALFPGRGFSGERSPRHHHLLLPTTFLGGRGRPEPVSGRQRRAGHEGAEKAKAKGDKVLEKGQGGSSGGGWRDGRGRRRSEVCGGWGGSRCFEIYSRVLR